MIVGFPAKVGSSLTVFTITYLACPAFSGTGFCFGLILGRISCMRVDFNKINKKRRVLVGVVTVVLVIVLLNVFQKEVKGFFYYISSPVQKVFWRAGERSAGFLESIMRMGNLKNKLNELTLKNQELITKIVYLEELEKENKVLREALRIGLQKEFRLALAQVIGKDISQDSILINKGVQDGLLKDMPIITEQNVLVGRVISVYDRFSKVMLISHKDSSLDAEFGVVRGQGNFNLLFDLIPREQEIFPGDMVVTSGFDNDFPKGLLIGQIKEVKKNDVEPFQQAEIEPAFNISRLDKVFVILEF